MGRLYALLKSVLPEANNALARCRLPLARPKLVRNLTLTREQALLPDHPPAARGPPGPAPRCRTPAVSIRTG